MVGKQMKKKALRKDFYMEIRRSIGRFLSIFFIVAIGCAFFSGIRSSEPDMRYSGDAYFDSKNLMDIQVISTMGLTADDLTAIENVDGIEKAEGGYSVDVLCTEGENKIVVHVMSMLPSMNEVQLEQGRLPEKENECAIDVDYLEEGKLEVGDSITFSSGSDDEITDTLKTDTYTIVGAVSSPCYISFQRGSATIGNGSVAAFAVVPEESFSLDVYTEIYAQVDGAKELTAFTDAYDNRVAEVLDRVESIKEERQRARYDEIVDGLNTLCDALHLPRKDFSRRIADCEAALEKAKAVIGDTPIAIDYTLCYRPLSLARLLLRKGFNVQRVYLDGIGEEKADFEALQREAPDLMLYATVEVKMRFLHGEDAGAGGEHFLALGQKAAYFTGSDNFVNIVECGGLYGFDGIIRLAGEMEDAYLHKKDARRLIQIKGFGGGCCL